MKYVSGVIKNGEAYTVTDSVTGEFQIYSRVDLIFNMQSHFIIGANKKTNSVIDRSDILALEAMAVRDKIFGIITDYGFDDSGYIYPVYDSDAVSIILPSWVETIHENTFFKALNLEYVKLSNRCKVIGKKAFDSLRVERVDFNEGLLEIQEFAFSRSNLKCAMLPDSIRSLGEYAFERTRELLTVRLPKYINEIPRGCFAVCPQIKYIELPVACKKVCDSAFKECYALDNITFSSVLEFIDQDAFSLDRNIKSIELPDSVTILGNGCFSNCYAIKSVKLPRYLTEIGNMVFNGCAKIPSIKIPDTCTKVGSYAFSGCRALENVELPDTLKFLYHKSFERCVSLKEIKIPKSLREITSGTFSCCASLEQVVFQDGLETISDYAFDECGKLLPFVLPESLIRVSTTAFKDTPYESLGTTNNPTRKKRVAQVVDGGAV